MSTLMRLRNFYLLELITLFNYVVHFERRPYLLKKELNRGFHVSFVQLSIKAKTIIHMLDKIKYPINSMQDLEILNFKEFKLCKQK